MNSSAATRFVKSRYEWPTLYEFTNFGVTASVATRFRQSGEPAKEAPRCQLACIVLCAGLRRNNCRGTFAGARLPERSDCDTALDRSGCNSARLWKCEIRPLSLADRRFAPGSDR